ncbi:MAG: hypothetical protein U0R23_05995 [Candidatus Nanopelagicales bacterium]
MSMVMAHAPVILPAVLRVQLPYRFAMYIPVVMLHASLLLRVLLGDGYGIAWAWRLGRVEHRGAAGIRRCGGVVGGHHFGAQRARTAARPGSCWKTAMNRTSWHLPGNAVVVAWLVALVVVTLVHPFITWSGWLLVHLLGLGALSNAILIWSWHFTAALVRLSDDVMRRGKVPRLVLINAGAVVVMAGVVSASPPPCWPAGSPWRWWRSGTPQPSGVACVPPCPHGSGSPSAATSRRGDAAVGAVFEVLLTRDIEAAHERVVLAHALVNILGWIGLTVIGTLVTLWPTMLRTHRRGAQSSRPAGCCPC